MQNEIRKQLHHWHWRERHGHASRRSLWLAKSASLLAEFGEKTARLVHGFKDKWAMLIDSQRGESAKNLGQTFKDNMPFLTMTGVKQWMPFRTRETQTQIRLFQQNERPLSPPVHHVQPAELETRPMTEDVKRQAMAAVAGRKSRRKSALLATAALPRRPASPMLKTRKGHIGP